MAWPDDAFSSLTGGAPPARRAIDDEWDPFAHLTQAPPIAPQQPGMLRRAADAVTGTLDAIPGYRPLMQALDWPVTQVEEYVAKPLGFESAGEMGLSLLAGNRPPGAIDAMQEAAERQLRAIEVEHPDLARYGRSGIAGLRKLGEFAGREAVNPVNLLAGAGIATKGTQLAGAGAKLAAIADPTAKVALAAFGPGMAEGALQASAAGVEAYDAAGGKITPEVAEHAAEALGSGAFLGLLGYGAFGGKGGPRAIEQPPQGLLGAAPEAPYIDVDFTTSPIQPSARRIGAPPLEAEVVTPGPAGPGPRPPFTPEGPIVDAEIIPQRAIEGDFDLGQPAGLLPEAPPPPPPPPPIYDQLTARERTVLGTAGVRGPSSINQAFKTVEEARKFVAQIEGWGAATSAEATAREAAAAEASAQLGPKPSPEPGTVQEPRSAYDAPFADLTRLPTAAEVPWATEGPPSALEVPWATEAEGGPPSALEVPWATDGPPSALDVPWATEAEGPPSALDVPWATEPIAEAPVPRAIEAPPAEALPPALAPPPEVPVEAPPLPAPPPQELAPPPAELAPEAPRAIEAEPAELAPEPAAPPAPTREGPRFQVAQREDGWWSVVGPDGATIRGGTMAQASAQQIADNWNQTTPEGAIPGRRPGVSRSPGGLTVGDRFDAGGRDEVLSFQADDNLAPGEEIVHEVMPDGKLIVGYGPEAPAPAPERAIEAEMPEQAAMPEGVPGAPGGVERRGPERLAGTFKQFYSALKKYPERDRQEVLNYLWDQAFEHPITGLKNRTRFAIDDMGNEHLGQLRVTWDMEGLKYANDRYGHPVGDEMLRVIAAAMRDEGIDAYHIGGDEFAAYALTQEQVDRMIQGVNERLKNARFDVDAIALPKTAEHPAAPAGRFTVTGITLWGGAGKTYEAADRGLLEVKKAAVAAGRRAGRGERPRSLVESPAAQPSDRVDYPPGTPAVRGEVPEGVEVPAEAPPARAIEAPPPAIEAPAPTKALDAAAHEAATSPTNERPLPTPEEEAAGNFKKGPVRVAGLSISIENPEGSVRTNLGKLLRELTEKPLGPALTTVKGIAEKLRGGDVPGAVGALKTGAEKYYRLRPAAKAAWAQPMKSHYGYIRGTEGKDKDHIDVFIRPGTPLDYDGPVYVVNQTNAKGAFDEHKALLGWATEAEALDAYKENYPAGWDRFSGASDFLTPDEFKRWLKNADTTKAAPLSYESKRRNAAAYEPPTEGAASKAAKLRKRVAYLDRLLDNPKLPSGQRGEVERQLAQARADLESLDGAPEKQDHVTYEEPGREPGLERPEAAAAEPADRPTGRDTEALEGVPPEEVSGPAREREPGERDRGELPVDEGRPRPGGREGPALRPGVGGGPGDLAPAGGRTSLEPGRSGVEGDPEAAAVLAPAEQEFQAARGVDHRILPDDDIGKGGPKQKILGNVEAIKLVRKLEAEGRMATPEEQAVLARYVGWGAFPQLFTPTAEGYYKPEWRELRDAMEEVLEPGSDAHTEARASTINAHFTSPLVINAMWDAVRRLGVKPRTSVLEPATGVGSFFGLQPADMLPASRTGVEKDETTALLAKHLYPNAAVFHKPFQEAKLPANHYGLAISNVPFANVPVHDPTFSKQPQVLRSLHDYFFAKALHLTRPGGLVAAITSHYTMDKKGTSVRRYLAGQADLLGAIRLPNTAFKGNAGTEVTTDILFLRKRVPGEAPGGEAWLESTAVHLEGDKGKTGDAFINEYFQKHPEMVLGRHSLAGKMYGPDLEYTLEGKLEPAALAAAVARLPQDALKTLTAEPPKPQDIYKEQVEEGDPTKQGAFAIRDGKLMVREGEFYTDAGLGPTLEPRVRGMVGIRDATRAVLDAQLKQGTTDAELKKLQKALSSSYDAYVKKHGPLNDPKNARAFDEDPDAPLLLALEDYDPDTKKAKKAAIFSQRTIAERRPIGRMESAKEALPFILSEYGNLDIGQMERVTGKKRPALLKELGDLAYINPEGEGVELASEYLSGNVRQKLDVARAAAKADPAYARNVKALEAAQPEDVLPSGIRVRLGAPWIPSAEIRDFIGELLGVPDYRREDTIKVAHSADLGKWDVEARAASRTTKAVDEWGIPEVNAVELVQMALNMRQPTVRFKDQDGKEFTDPVKTVAAREKQHLIQEEFRRWLWADDARAERLARLYNDTQNNIRAQIHDGSHLEFPGMARLTLRGGDLGPHQKNGAWRIIRSSPKTNVLINHAVGAGKTFEIAAAIMEMRRTGAVKKAVVSVPKHITAQWAAEFLRLYPTANLLTVDAKGMTPKKRQLTMAKMATGNYDAIVMSFENLSKLPVRAETYKGFVEEQIAQLRAAILDAKAAQGGGKDSRIVKDLEKRIEALQAKIANYVSLHEKDTGVTFEDLGADLLVVDEAHAFKRLDSPSALQVRGIARGGSNRAMDLYMKSRFTNGRGGRIVFATATPITNTMGEAYVVQRFLQPELLRERSIQSFDGWAATFGDVVSAAEMDATGKFKPVSRFARFVNVPELSTLIGQTMDTMLPEDLNLPVPKVATGGPQVVSAPASKELVDYVDRLGDRADMVRGGSVDPKDDNMLKITTDGRKAATDMRLIDPNLPDDPNSKLNLAAGKVASIFKRTRDRKATQLVFLDLGTPKDGGKAAPTKKAAPEAEGAEDVDDPSAETAEEERLNESLYADLKKKMVREGIPADKIAFIHDANTDAKKLALQRKLNNGELAVLMGSTSKMGTGLNVQKKLYAMHLISPPMRPDQVEQALGRIIRQGNEHLDLDIPVEIFYYATEGSYDAVLYQMLETKQRFVNDFQKAKPGVRVVEDTGTVELSFAQAKAIASGDPRIMQKVNLDAEVSKLQSLRAAHDDAAFRRKQAISGFEQTIDWTARKIPKLQADLAKFQKAKAAAGTDFAMKVEGATFDDRTKAGEALIAAANTMQARAAHHPLEIGSHLGFPITILWTPGLENKLASTLLVGDYAANLSESPLGVVASVGHALSSSIEWELQQVEASKARATKDLADAQALLGKPFAKEAELKEKSAQAKRLADELGMSKAEAEQAVTVGAAGPGEVREGRGAYGVAPKPGQALLLDGTPYEDPPTRLEARKEAYRAAGQLALDFGRPGRESALPSVRARRPLRGIEAGSGVRTVGINVTIPKELRSRGWVDLRGNQLRTAEDLAVLARIYRDPRYETARIFYTKGDKIVAEEAFSSRLPGTATFYEAGDKANIARGIEEMRRRMERLEADGYWLLHNHPSGAPRPSPQDVALTRHLRDNLPGFKGHVVIDGHSYGIIPPDIEGRGAGVIPLPKAVAKVEPIFVQPEGLELPQGAAEWPIHNARDLAKVGASLKAGPDYVAIVYTDSRGVTRAAQDMPVKLFARPKEAAKFIRRQRIGMGAGRAFAYFPPRPGLEASATALMRDGILDDAVPHGGASRTEMGVAAGDTALMGKPIRRHRVAEEAAPYRAPTDEEIREGAREETELLRQRGRDRAANANRLARGEYVAPWERKGFMREETAPYGEKAPPFFSKLARVAQKIPQPMKGADLARYLADPKRGVKAEEMKWTGLDDFLKERADQKVTPAQVQEFVAQNEVKVEEVRLGARVDRISADEKHELKAWLVANTDSGYTPRQAAELVDRAAQGEENSIGDLEQLGAPDQLLESLHGEGEERAGNVKFAQYQEPGGENYREVLLTLPKIHTKKPYEHWLRENLAGHEDSAMARSLYAEAKEPGTPSFRAGHFDDPNVLAHVRLNDRTDVDGKRVLFVEEIQSDWAQKGRREGFGPGVSPDADLVAKSVPAGYYVVETAGGTFVTNVMPYDISTAPPGGQKDMAISVARERLRSGAVAVSAKAGVPSAPFVGKTENWTALALKRILRMAAEEGYDRVAWTTGEQQAARYDLSKQIDSIEFSKERSGRDFGTVDFTVHGKAGQELMRERNATPQRVEEVIGKEMLERIAAHEDTDGVLSGLDLKVGGEGMKGFYDQIVPSVAAKLAKKWGAKVGETTVGTGGKVEQMADSTWQALGPKNEFLGDAPTEAAARALIGTKGPAIDITPEMRKGVVGEGFELFEQRRAYQGAGAPPVEPPGPKQASFFFDGDEALNRLRTSSAGTAHDLGGAAAAGARVLRDLGIYAASVVEKMARGATIPDFRGWAKPFLAGLKGIVKGLGARLRGLYDAAVAAYRGRARKGAGAQPPPPAAAQPAAGGRVRMSVPEETLLQKIQRIVQDRLNRIETYEKAARAQGAPLRAKLKDLFDAVTPKAAERLQEVERELVDPLVRLLAKKGLDLKDLDRYVYARHAPDRNRVIADRTEGRNMAGSGMTDAEAARILSDYQKAGKTPDLDAAADYVKKMRERQIEVLIDGGLISREQAKAWRKTMGDDYVPLRTAEIEEGIGTGQGFDIRGKEVKAATGRGDLADSPVAAMLQQLNRAIVRAEKNLADQAFAEFVKDNDLFEVDATYTRTVLGKDGKTRTQADPLRAQEDFHYKVDGEAHRIDVASKDPILDRALKNMSAKETGNFVRALGNLTRIYSQLVTSWNPEFLFTNFVRDLQTAVGNVGAERSAKMAKELLKNVPAAIKGMYEAVGNPSSTAAWAKIAKEFREAGGAVGWYSIKDLAGMEADLAAKVRGAGPGILKAGARLAKGFTEWVGRANQSVEGGVRLAYFKALRDAGLSAADAASAARRVTIDFNKKGEMGPVANSLYAFFNANVQGAARLGQVLATKRGAALAGAIATSGWALDAYNRAVAGDADKDGENDYDQIPEYVKERNLVFARGGGKRPFLIPLPYGFNVIQSAGRHAGGIMAGTTTPAEAALALAGSTYNAFNPLGADADLLQTLSPTILDPFVQHAMNKDFTGKKIRPENYPGGRQKPDSELYFKNVSPFSRELAAGLNRATGGDPVTPGYVDVSPETLEHVFGFVTGGVGRFASGIAATGTAVAKGEPISSRNLPVVRRFTYERREGIDMTKVLEQYQGLFGNEDLRRVMAQADYAPAPPERRISLGGGRSVELTEPEYRTFVNADKKMTDRLKSLVRDPRFQRLPLERRKAFLQARYRLAAEDARRQVRRTAATRYREAS